MKIIKHEKWAKHETTNGERCTHGCLLCHLKEVLSWRKHGSESNFLLVAIARRCEAIKFIM